MMTDRMDEPTWDYEETPETPPETSEPKLKPKSGFAVLAVQSVVCALLLGAALVARLIGGGVSDWCRTEVGKAMGDNRVVEWIFGEWSDGDVSDGSEKSAEAVSSEEASTEPGPQLPFVSDSVPASAVYMTMPEPVEQMAAVRRDLPLPPCLPLLYGTLTSGYGEREHPISGEDSFHTGWDIAAEEGTPIAAMYDAMVTEVGSGGSYGNYVEMRVSDRLSFLYAHCFKVLVREGDRVTAGETVARVGSTGVSTGNHLHVEVLVDGETCDPSIVLAPDVYPAAE